MVLSHVLSNDSRFQAALCSASALYMAYVTLQQDAASQSDDKISIYHTYFRVISKLTSRLKDKNAIA